MSAIAQVPVTDFAQLCQTANEQFNEENVSAVARAALANGQQLDMRLVVPLIQRGLAQRNEPVLSHLLRPPFLSFLRLRGEDLLVGVNTNMSGEGYVLYGFNPGLVNGREIMEEKDLFSVCHCIRVE